VEGVASKLDVEEIVSPEALDAKQGSEFQLPNEGRAPIF
jgi:hypothetical protein